MRNDSDTNLKKKNKKRFGKSKKFTYLCKTNQEKT